MSKITKIKSRLINDQEYDTSRNKMLSLIFLFGAFIMTFFVYKESKLFNLITNEVDLKPEAISSIIALLMLTPIYHRGILKWKKSNYSLLSFFFIISIFSSLVKLCLSGETFFFGEDITYFMLFMAVILSWVGVKSVAGLSWILVLVFASISIIVNSSIMGYYGFMFILFSVLGLVFNSELSFSDLMRGFASEYSSQIPKKRIATDIDKSAELGKEVIKKTANIAMKVAKDGIVL